MSECDLEMIFESLTCFFLSSELSNSACLINGANPKFENFEICVGDYIEMTEIEARGSQKMDGSL